MRRTNYFTKSTELRPCAYGKTRHTTRGHAEHALRRRRTSVETRQFAVIRCLSCRYWHVEVVGDVGRMPDFEVPPDKPAFDATPRGWHLDLKPVATCSRRKNRYHSLDEAEVAMEELKRSPTYRLKAGELNLYRCLSCDAYHIGHRLG